MTEQDNGGPAFPYEHGHSPDAANVREPGMSLRDWFAGVALFGILIQRDRGTTYHRTAEEAYGFADAMLERRGS